MATLILIYRTESSLSHDEFYELYDTSFMMEQGD